MKILIATGIYPPDIGGPATFVKRLSELLVEKNISIKILSYGETDKDFSDGKISVTTISRKHGKFKRYVRYIRAIKQLSKSVDLIYGQGLISSGLPVAINNLLTGKRYILRIGGDFLWEQALERNWTGLPLLEYFETRKSLRERIYLWIYRFTLRRSKLVIFNSDLLCKLYIQKLKLNPDKTTIIHNAQPARLTTQSSLSGDFVFAGRLITLKNLRRLLKAFSEIETDKRLKLIGDGPYYKACQKHIKEYKLWNRVEIEHALPNQELIQELQKAFAVIVPSLTEINPNIALESIACGVPVLITKNNGLPSDISGKLWEFDPYSTDQIKQQMKNLLDSKIYSKYKQVIESIDLNFTWSNVVDLHLELFYTHANS